jgi:hypothetical protein
MLITFLVKLIELVLQRLLVGRGVVVENGNDTMASILGSSM